MCALIICCQLQVTAKPTSMREESELTPILRVLQRIEFTADLETAVLRQLARFVMYESYPAAGHMVVKQGDPGSLFYIILSGLLLAWCHMWHSLYKSLSHCKLCGVCLYLIAVQYLYRCKTPDFKIK